MRILYTMTVAVFAFGLGAAGCSGMCDRYAEMSTSCLKNEDQGATSVEECEQDMEKCTEADEKVFEDYITCMETNAECEGGKSTNDDEALACFSDFSKDLSDVCWEQ